MILSEKYRKERKGRKEREGRAEGERTGGEGMDERTSLPSALSTNDPSGWKGTARQLKSNRFSQRLEKTLNG